MRNIKYYMLLPLILLLMSNTTSPTSKYKCMIQLKNYTGEGAYIVVSVVDKDGKYLTTLRVLGDDEEWYPDLTKWYGYYKEGNQKVDGISGATISGGERTLFVFELDEKYLVEGNQLRFESAVEEQKYTVDDVQIPIMNNKIAGTHEGKEYIRYVKILPN